MSLTRSNVVDANVWLPLFAEQHEAHHRTIDWFARLEENQAGLCRLVQITLLRLLGSRTVMGSGALPASDAWSRIELALGDERVAYLDEPPALASVWPTLFRYSEPTPKLVNDAYLAAFAIAGGHTLVTRDRGFLEFPGLDVELLG